MIYIILAVLMIILSLQTRVGEKVTILVERVGELWTGKKRGGKKKGQGQPSQQPPTVSSSPPPPPPPPSYIDQGGGGTPITDSSAYYQQDINPLVGAATPGSGTDSFQPMEPMAANLALGGGGSWGNW